MNCEKYKAQIEEQLGKEALPIDAVHHIEACADCRTFSGEHTKLREMLDCLQSVNAPSDFNFRLKARMKRAEKPVSAWTWQKLVGASTATLAALAVGFVVLNNSSVGTNTAVISNPQPVIEQPIQSSVVAQVKPAETPQQPVVEVENEVSAPPEAKPQTAQRQTKSVKVVPRRSQPKAADEEIRVKDSPIFVSEPALSPALPSMMPKGIPDQLQEPKKQNAGEILRTLGVETETVSDGLRVTKSNRVDLKTGDIIQKVNDENPAAVPSGVLNEIKLTVRRQDQTREVKILAKP